MASTVLPNGIIIPEKYSRDWYNDLYHNWQELDNLLGGGTPKDGTLTIQKNGTTVGTFSANQSTNATANITVPTKTSDLTNDSGFITSDNTKIPLAGSNAISGSLIPATTDAYDLGDSSYQWNNAYIKSLTINGVACGDILTHNASEFVDVSSDQTVGGEKDFTSNQKMKSLIINPTASIYKAMYGSSEAVICQYGEGTVPESNINPFRFYVGKARNYAGAPIIIDTNMLTTGGTNIIFRSASNESENALDHRLYVGTSVTDNGDGTKTRNAYVQFYNTNEVKPNKNNYCNLGTASLKWADVNTALLNGLNPGALSLPSATRVKVDTTDFVWDGVTQNTIEPPIPCIIYILVTASKIVENGTISAGNTVMYTSSQIIKNNVSNCGSNNNYAIASVQANAGDRVIIRLSLSSSLSGSDGVFYRPLLGNV